MIRKNFSLPILLACGALTALGQQNIAPGGPTPFEVLNGSATLAGSFDPNLMLRVVLGLQPPNWAEEQQFLEQLPPPGSPPFLQFLTPDEWNARFSPSVTAAPAGAEDQQGREQGQTPGAPKGRQGRTPDEWKSRGAPAGQE